MVEFWNGSSVLFRWIVGLSSELERLWLFPREYVAAKVSVAARLVVDGALQGKVPVFFFLEETREKSKLMSNRECSGYDGKGLHATYLMMRPGRRSKLFLTTSSSSLWDILELP
jgi:hypothetical protein